MQVFTALFKMKITGHYFFLLEQKHVVSWNRPLGHIHVHRLIEDDS